jgi:hypothetical protein
VPVGKTDGQEGDQKMAVDRRLGACGLDCTKCDQYKLPTDKAVQARMIPYYRQRGWLKEGEGLETAIEKRMYCKGCGNPEVCWSPKCEIMKCCKQEKKLDDCSACTEFPCERITEHGKLNKRYQEAVEYLEARKADGV